MAVCQDREEGRDIEEMKQKVINKIRILHPGTFALVMATGIVSIAAFLMHLTDISWILFFISIAAYCILCLLFLIRIVIFPKYIVRDFTDTLRALGFFTSIAATTVLGREVILLTNSLTVALWLWFLSLFLWVILSYIFFIRIFITQEKPHVGKELTGAWLLTVVATQGVSLLGARIVSKLPSFTESVLFLTLIMYTLGCLLYILLISFIFNRLLFLVVDEEEMGPSYWITMGAGAITTLAGATLIASADQVAFLHTILPFLIGFTLLFWTSATWWLPFLVILGLWRHLYHHIAFDDGLQYWSIVFPLGMYTVATYELATAMHIPFLLIVPRVFVYIALTSWIIVCIFRLYNLYKGILTK